MMNQNTFIFHSFHYYSKSAFIWWQLRNYSDCFFVKNNQMMLQSHLVTRMWPSFGDSAVKSSWPLLCDEFPSDMTMKARGVFS